ncbi:MAG: hypothetical protein ABIA56_01045, partial [Actinomycetota bacterium]
MEYKDGEITEIKYGSWETTGKYQLTVNEERMEVDGIIVRNNQLHTGRNDIGGGRAELIAKIMTETEKVVPNKTLDDLFGKQEKIILKKYKR